MRVAYVCCAGTLSTATDRRYDAHEHDNELAAMLPAFESAGDELVECDWRAKDWNPAEFDLAFVRTTWDYTEYPGEFESFVTECAKECPVANMPGTIIWNHNKRYLADCDAMGLPIIPVLFPDNGATTKVAFDRFACDELILKPVIGAGGEGHMRVRVGDADAPIPATHFAQPVLDEINTEGEISFIFIGGEFSHAVRKRCAPGEYRVQSNFGGTEERYDSTDDDLRIAASFLEATPDPTLACRIDMVPTNDGLQLMELEAIEPYLFPNGVEDFGERIHSACKKSIAEIKR